MLSHKALHPNIVQRADGSVDDIGEGGFIPAERHRACTRMPRSRGAPTTAFRRTGSRPSSGAIGRPAAARTADGDRRRDDPRPPAHAGRGRRRAGAHPGRAREARRARRHGRPADRGQRLLLRRARPERGAPARLRGVDPAAPAGPLSQLVAGRLDARRRWRSRSTWRRRCSSWPGSRRPRTMDGRSLVPVLHGAGRRLAPIVPDRVQQRHRLPAHATAWATTPCAPSATSTSAIRELTGMDELYDLEARSLRAAEPHGLPARGKAPRGAGA